MSDPATYEKLFARINEAFTQGDYAAVVEMTERHCGEYLEQKPRLIYMQICAAARLGQNEQVIRVLDEAIQEGLWYSERALRESPSLRPLIGIPEYEQLIARSVEVATKRKAFSKKLITVEPDKKSGSAKVLFALHANGSSAREAAGHWHSLVEMGWQLALPQSPSALWKGTYNWEDGPQTIEMLHDLYTQVGPAEQVLLGGHSMGGKLAVELALTGQIRSRGFIAVAPYISEEDLASWEALIEKTHPENFRGVLFFGDQDETIPHSTIYELGERLEQQGIDVWVQHFDGVGHEFGLPIQQALEQAVAFILS